MSAPEFTGDEAHDQAALRAAFPDWRIARVGGQWWASRNLVREDLTGALKSSTAEDLHAQLTASAARMMFGRVAPVLDVLRARAPEVESVGVDPGADGEGPFLRVRYRGGAPRRIVWDKDLDTYRWDSGPDAPQPLSADPLQAAETIVRSLGAPMTRHLK